MNKITYGKQLIDENDINSVVKALKSDFLTQGNKIEEFEDKVAKYHNSKYAVSFSNGTAALHGCYHVFNLQKGDEFITTPITFAASSNAGLYCSATPKFVDIDKKTYNIDITKIEQYITNKTKIITPVSYAGYPVDIKELKKITDKYNIKIIYDAAHAIGSRINNDDISDHADCTVLSFHPVKHITTGEGGMVLTNDHNIYEKLKIFRNHGITKDLSKLQHSNEPWYHEMQELGYNYRLTDIQCALGISQMEKLGSSIYKRNKIAKFYKKHLKDINWIQLPQVDFDVEWLNDPKYKNIKNKPKNLHSYHLYPIKIKTKELRLKFFNYLHKNNIFVQVHYIPVHTHPYYQQTFNYKWGDFPLAEEFYNKEISIPMYPSLQKSELDYIVSTIKNFKY